MKMPDFFLLDEVRCGFMVPSAIKQAWAAQLEVLAEIDRVCRKHNIQYFADWGTLLGTVRHGGYIPWDDDLDIVMKREDYIRFLTVASQEMDAGFTVRTFRNHDDNWLFMAKVVGNNTFCFKKEHLRRFHNFPYIASVDIFVLDYAYREPEKEEERRELCKYMLAIADSLMDGNMSREDRETRIGLLEKKCGHAFVRYEQPIEMRRYLYGEIEKVFAEVPEQEADKLTQIFPWGLKGDWFQFPKKYYEKAVYLPFEYTVMPVPLMYDKMLRQRYGDYVRLVKTAGAHDYPFFEGQKKNLQKVLDFRLPEFVFDRTKLFRSEEEEACKNFSYKAMGKECLNELIRMKNEVSALTGREVIEMADTEKILDLLASSQELAVDLGNMLEPFLEEGSSIVPLLEQYCETIYRIYMKVSGEADGEIADEVESAGTVLNAIIDDMNSNVFARKTVLFLPVVAKDWGALQGLWDEYVNDEKNDVYVIPLPYFYKDYDGSPRKICNEAEVFPKELRVLDYNMLTPEYLELLHPETIVIQNPYDAWNPNVSVPETFYALNLRKYTDELIYMPPFTVEEYSVENEREYLNMQYYVTMPGVVYADRVLAQSENMRRVYIEKLIDFAGKETKTAWEKKMTAQEVVETITEPKGLSDKKRVLYVISFGAYITDVGTAKEKIERNFQIFAEHRDKIELTVSIFPDSAESNEVRDYVNDMLETYTGEFVTGDKVDAGQVADYDAYYGDVTPLLMDFRDAGKPIMVQDYLC